MTLETIELELSNQPDASIIWLHGLGADGNDFAGIVPELHLPASCKIRFIFPHAPYRPITLNNGYVMRGWYDISSLQFGNGEDEDGIRESQHQIEQLIEQEIARGISPQRIILAGFSQGGAITLHTGLRYSQPLGGLMVLSSYLPLANTLAQEASQENKHIPLFMAHGLQDDIVNYQYGVQSRMHLQQAGYSIDWHDYPMGHSVCMEEIRHISQWIQSTLA